MANTNFYGIYQFLVLKIGIINGITNFYGKYQFLWYLPIFGIKNWYYQFLWQMQIQSSQYRASLQNRVILREKYI